MITMMLGFAGAAQAGPGRHKRKTSSESFMVTIAKTGKTQRQTPDGATRPVNT